jgi:hypothetical protein
MQKDKEGTYYRKGWMRDFISGKLKQSPVAEKPVRATTKKRVAKTVTGGALSTSNTQKPIDDMSAEEYEQHMFSRGVRF